MDISVIEHERNEESSRLYIFWAEIHARVWWESLLCSTYSSLHTQMNRKSFLKQFRCFEWYFFQPILFSLSSNGTIIVIIIRMKPQIDNNTN